MPPSNGLTPEMIQSLKREASVYGLQNVFAGNQRKALKMLEPLFDSINTQPIETAMTEKWYRLENFHGTPQEYNSLSMAAAKDMSLMFNNRLCDISDMFIDIRIKSAERNILIQAWAALDYLHDFISKKQSPTANLKNKIALALLGIRDSFVCSECNSILPTSHISLNNKSVYLCPNCSYGTATTVTPAGYPSGQMYQPAPAQPVQHPVQPIQPMPVQPIPPVQPVQYQPVQQTEPAVIRLTEENVSTLKSMSARFMPDITSPAVHRELFEMASAIIKANAIKLVMESPWTKLEKSYTNNTSNYDSLSKETLKEVAYKIEKYLSSLKEKYITQSLDEADAETMLKAWIALDFYDSLITDGNNTALAKCKERIGVFALQRIESAGNTPMGYVKYNPQMMSEPERYNVSPLPINQNPILHPLKELTPPQGWERCYIGIDHTDGRLYIEYQRKVYMGTQLTVDSRFLNISYEDAINTYGVNISPENR